MPVPLEFMIKSPDIPSVSVHYPATGAAAGPDALGMRPMQEKVTRERGIHY